MTKRRKTQRNQKNGFDPKLMNQNEKLSTSKSSNGTTFLHNKRQSQWGFDPLQELNAFGVFL
jgi:hypothetical protein